MNLKDVLNETPMETLERVRRRLRSTQTSATGSEGSLSNVRGAMSSDGHGGTTGSTETKAGMYNTSSLNLNAILASAGIATAQIPSAAINLAPPSRTVDAKSLLTLSSLEYIPKSVVATEEDDPEETILQLAALPIKKAALVQQLPPPPARTFVSLNCAVSEAIDQAMAESPRSHFSAYIALQTGRPFHAECVED